MNVSLQQLRVFVAVARERSFTRAARELDLTQSAVSRCVRELEDAVELKLFDRTTRQVELTHAGASLERRIGRLLDEIDLTLREERAAYEGHRGVVVLASNPVLSSSWVAQGLARCASAFPELLVSVEDQAQSGVLASVEHGEVDFGVVSLAEPLANDQLHAQLVFTTPLHAVMPSTHPLARHASVAWDELHDWSLVTLNADAGVRAALERAFSENGLKRRPVQEFGHVAAVLRMVELGLGVGVLPVDSHWPTVGESLVSRPLVPEVTLATLLVHRRNRSLRPNAAAAWAQFAEHAGASSSTGGASVDVEPAAGPKLAADVVSNPVSRELSRPVVARSGAALHEP
ncbi:LysR family transcriptional regulator [bacterium M00.F.Ca.ET.228.01.1.1]|uniref:Transcriptional regulator, LysR family n=1 Tax=Burkholderia sp. (strain CCGE1003) TaxID=640512 RepID=E1TEZ6_BURSG|nr:LysR family transcriptional regulator [Paraburkholderia phenoliruptrix]TGP40143.1 LysR family transcriptional regulator [bacterium M00.F.Ca.ET.228.01.1.1]TGR96118.1 LysR family transcriptional regulator [bacterium M00.F.Ca.ET.191.01.1.1]TGT97255.1 LysR family transcriptional regulator [bacterium M00.F.Ca.ET.155.01.1.1]MBW0450700.1 LysR family transcriptional regulator [Paraburkholderia phenoliruptrix]MBW9101819.1 LysR family transcriptional regulator [Paraburkholderia phenoliruptrix]